MPGERRPGPEASDPERVGGAAPPATGAASAPGRTLAAHAPTPSRACPEIPSGSEAVTPARLPRPASELFVFVVAGGVSAAVAVTVERWPVGVLRPCLRLPWRRAASVEACALPRSSLSGRSRSSSWVVNPPWRKSPIGGGSRTRLGIGASASSAKSSPQPSTRLPLPLLPSRRLAGVWTVTTSAPLWPISEGWSWREQRCSSPTAPPSRLGATADAAWRARQGYAPGRHVGRCAGLRRLDG